MTAPISTAVGSIALPLELSQGRVTAPESGQGFAQVVSEAMGQVEALSERASVVADGYVAGSHQDVHGTMIALQEADVTLRLATSIRNRVIDAYREVMRMGA